jgi:glycerophosphoryl diester phosphodiesterase
VIEHSFSHLQHYSVHEPKRFGDRYVPQPIPTLQAVVELVKRHPECTLFIEAKRASITHFGVEPYLDALGPIVETTQEQCVLISFDDQILVAAKQRQLCPLGWVFEDWSDEALGKMDRLQPDYVFTDYADVPAQFESLPHGSWKWVVYTIDDAELALQWFRKGATLVETNNIGALIEHPLLNIVD